MQEGRGGQRVWRATPETVKQVETGMQTLTCSGNNMIQQGCKMLLVLAVFSTTARGRMRHYGPGRVNDEGKDGGRRGVLTCCCRRSCAVVGTSHLSSLSSSSSASSVGGVGSASCDCVSVLGHRRS